jgi:hypothetical protein
MFNKTFLICKSAQSSDGDKHQVNKQAKSIIVLIDRGFIDVETAPISPGQSAAFKGNVIRGATVQATRVTWSE